MCTISIIIPIYNVAPYLSQCIDSLLSQTFKNWELLLIDDGSNDSSGAICDEYVLRDSRICVVHIPNGGVSHARNLGMSMAKGEWVTFVDGDDWVACDYLEKLYAPITQYSQIDFVQGGCQNYKEGAGSSINTQFEPYQGTNKLYLIQHYRGLAISKLFRKSIIDRYGLRFDKQIVIGEDHVFTLDYILHIQCYAFIDSVGYYYRYRETSATKSMDAPPAEKVVYKLNHHLASLKAYLVANNIGSEEVQTRWKEISNDVFNAIRCNGFFSIKQRQCFKNYLKQYPLIKYQPRKERKIYFSLFLLL